MSLQNTKTILAKLLATENISVEFRNVPTAYFDMKSRLMVLPQWKDITPELYDLLGGHEVGHALNTPAEGWHTAVTENVSANFKTFLNVVEDARIERKIKERFPGIRKSFLKGYAELVSRDFFGIKNRDVNEMMLIDRINIHFKLGNLACVKFKNEKEEEFVARIESAETWNDVYEISKDLFAYCKEELEEMKKQRQEMMSKMFAQGEEEDGDGAEGESVMSDDAEESDGDASGAGEESDEDFDSDSEGEQSAADGEDSEDDSDAGDPVSRGGGQGYTHDPIGDLPDEPVSITDKNFQEKVKTLSDDKLAMTGNIPSMNKIDLSSRVVSWKNLSGKFFAKTEHYKPDLLAKFEAKNKAAINYLVKEFEMRKKAAELKRVSISETGIIDTNLLHSYKYTDSIFRKMATVAEGKNHGLVAMVDWSGSMTNNLSGTIEQMLILTMFCKKVNIPFEVLVFSTEYKQEDGDFVTQHDRNSLDTRGVMSLLNVLSNKMSSAAFRSMAVELLNVAHYYNSRTGGTYWASRVALESSMTAECSLGGTPLNLAIIALSKYVNDFKKANKLEVVNTAIISDGEDSSNMFLINTEDYNRGLYPSNWKKNSYVFDPDTKQTFKIVRSITDTLLEILKARTGCNLLGFFIVDNKRGKFHQELSRLSPMDSINIDATFAKFRNDGVFTVKGCGYDEFYLIPGGDNLEANDDSLDDILKSKKEDSGKISTRKLKSAFMSLNQNRLNSRILLKKFIEQTT